MPRQTPSDFDPIGIDFDYSPFDWDALDRVIGRTGLKPVSDTVCLEFHDGDQNLASRVALMEMLNSAAKAHRAFSELQDQPTPYAYRDAAKAIQKSINILLRRLGLHLTKYKSSAKSLRPEHAVVLDREVLRRSPPLLIRNIDRTVPEVGQEHWPDLATEFWEWVKLTERLYVWSLNVSVALDEKGPIPQAERGNLALKEFAFDCIRAYGLVFGRKPTYQRDPYEGGNNKPFGPLIEFLLATIAVLDVPLPAPGTLADWIDDYRHQKEKRPDLIPSAYPKPA